MAEGINVNERGELINSQPPVEAVPIQTVVDFLSEFNANAAIFNETVAPALGMIALNSLSIRDVMADHYFLKQRVYELEEAYRLNANADDRDFQDCAHAPPGEPC